MVAAPGLRYLKGAIKVDNMLTFSRRKQKRHRDSVFCVVFCSTPHSPQVKTSCQKSGRKLKHCWQKRLQMLLTLLETTALVFGKL